MIIMFGSLKKKLQEAIGKVTAPKKEEVEEEIKKEELQEEKKVLAEEVEGLKIREEEARALIERRKVEDFGKKAAHLKEDIEAREDVEKTLVGEVEEKLAEKKDEKIEDIAKEEFEKMTHPREEKKPSLVEEILREKEELKEEVYQQKLRDEQELIAKDLKKRYEEDVKEILGTPVERDIEKKKEEKRGFIRSIVKKIAEKTLDEKDIYDIIKNLQLALLENDTALEVAERICDGVQKELKGKSVKRGEVEAVVKEALKRAMLSVMKQEKVDIDSLLKKRTEPLLVMFLGFNGTGKTTTLAKAAYKFRDYNPIIAAGDTFRAASIEQLEEHGRRLGVDVVKHSYGADSAAVIFDAKKHAAAAGSKLVLADTAGRSHSNVNLMDELRKVVKVNKPDLKILVLDSLAGNDIYEQAKLFNEAVGVDAIILTKADVYDRGGAALSAAYTIKKPILYLGVGQEYADLKEFVPEEVVKSLLE